MSAKRALVIVIVAGIAALAVGFGPRIACLLLSITAQASPARSAPAYAVQPGVVSGGGYALTGLGWHVSGETQSQRYTLSSPASPGSSENGCCCVYLPCLQKH